MNVRSRRRLKPSVQKALRRNPQQKERDYFAIVTTSAAVVVACIAAFFAAEQAITAKETMRRQLRAYVTIELSKDPEVEEGKVKIAVKVTNVGVTPADHVQLSFVRPHKDRAPLLADFTGDSDAQLHALAVYNLGANQSYTANVTTSVTENNLIQNKQTGELALVTMKVDYADVFHQWHVRPYCIFITPPDFYEKFMALPCNVADAYDD